MTQMVNKGIIRRTAGYTIDQTILIVAVIAILITLIIASVGWDILNRTSGTKLASSFRQIEDSNGQFFARNQMWPHIAVAASGVAVCTGAVDVASIGVLADPTCVPVNLQAAHKDLLPSLPRAAAAPNQVQHTFGNGGAITQNLDLGPAGFTCGANVISITFADVPTTEILEADGAIDKGVGGVVDQTGRLRWTAPANGVADVTYCANAT